MSRKLPFKVIHVSGSEDGFNGKELETHGPTTKGWQSSRFSMYPQEIIICLEEPSLISKIQILSHQYNIASKVEMFISIPATPGTMSLVGCKFKRLGYIHMSTNEGTKFQARELKSVHVNVEGQLIKLIIHKNHVNKLNLYNQVCLVALNVLGQSLSNEYHADMSVDTGDLIMKYFMNQVNTNETQLNPAPLYQHQPRLNDGNIISPLDDLSFDMYQDPETAQLIRKLDDKKRQAIQEERYDYAKKLKQAMADLHKVGEKLGKFEVEKRRAVEMENFDLAKSKKEKDTSQDVDVKNQVMSDEYRLHVYKQLDIYDLLEIKKTEVNTVVPVHKNAFEENFKTPTKPRQTEDIVLPPVKVPKNKSPRETSRIEDTSIVTTPSLNKPLTPRVAVEYTDQNDERPLPALKGKSVKSIQEMSQQKQEEHESVETDNTENVDDIDLKKLSEKEEREAELIIEVFGMNTAKQIYSKSWKHRHESIMNLTAQIEDFTKISEDHSPKLITRASMQVLNKTLQDQVYVVLQHSVDFLKTLLLTFIPQSKTGKTEIMHVLEKVIPAMLKRTGDSAIRCRSMMADSIVDIAKQPEVKNLGTIPNLLSEPVKKKKQPPWRLLKSQIEIMTILIQELGIDRQGGFTLDRIMKVLVAGFDHANNEVREAALKCIIDVYKTVKEPVKSYFPPDTIANRKNPLLLKLYDCFDRADGKPTENEKKALAKKQKEEADKNKQAEIEALQSQLQDLRSIASQKLENKENVTVADGDSNNNNKTANETNTTQGQKNTSKVPSKSKSNIKQASLRKMKEPVKRESKPKTKPDEQTTVPDRLCIFCGEENDSFSEEGLDVHYWKTCPMLKRCDACSQVVEISTMSDHLLSECEKKENYTKCRICQIAIEKIKEKEHTESPQCKDIEMKDKHTPCPLCLQLTPSHDNSWRDHLILKCKPNLERLKIGKGIAVTKTPSKTPSKLSKKSTVGSTTRGRGRGSSVSKIPSRTPSKKR